MKPEEKEVLDELLNHCKGLEKEFNTYNKRENRKLVASIVYSFSVLGVTYLFYSGKLSKLAKKLEKKIKKLEKEEKKEEIKVEEQPTDQ